MWYLYPGPTRLYRRPEPTHFSYRHKQTYLGCRPRPTYLGCWSKPAHVNHQLVLDHLGRRPDQACHNLWPTSTFGLTESISIVSLTNHILVVDSGWLFSPVGLSRPVLSIGPNQPLLSASQSQPVLFVESYQPILIVDMTGPNLAIGSG